MRNNMVHGSKLVLITYKNNRWFGLEVMIYSKVVGGQLSQQVYEVLKQYRGRIRWDR